MSYEERYVHMRKNGGWIGVDLDGTLAEYHGWIDSWHIGPPVPAMLERVKAWLAEGIEVRILTARVAFDGRSHGMTADEVRATIQAWCVEHLGVALEVTATKDLKMIELWDDRCIQVIPNTGQRVDGGP